MTERHDDEIEDLGPELRADGTIRFEIDGERFRLRMPRLGELRHLKAQRVALLDSLRDAGKRFEPEEEQLRARQQTARDRLREADPNELVEAGEELRTLVREITEASERITAELELVQQGLVIEWVRETVALLSRPKGSDTGSAVPLPEEDDDLPVWVSSLQTTTEWIEHWMTFPKRPGA